MGSASMKVKGKSGEMTDLAWPSNPLRKMKSPEGSTNLSAVWKSNAPRNTNNSK